jgi:hypothetical protein
LTDVSKFFFRKRIKLFALAYLRFSFRFLLWHKLVELLNRDLSKVLSLTY